MRNKTAAPAATFKALFKELISCSFIYALLRRCGVRRRCPPVITAVELVQGLVFHVISEAGTLAQHVKQLTGKSITDGALAQRRDLLPPEVFEELMGAALKPKADRSRHPEAFYHGLRLCGVDGSLFSVSNTPQVKKQMRKARSRRGRAAFPKVGVAVMVELGLHNPLAAALGAYVGDDGAVGAAGHMVRTPVGGDVPIAAAGVGPSDGGGNRRGRYHSREAHRHYNGALTKCSSHRVYVCNQECNRLPNLLP
jgi:hypothetical protein